ncbi:clathrin interactor 1-like isoform X3 [Gigantopelta aegis]|uniref:clathrin interactor 1-like isoform X3 n=1 Tax=Gigantopelta aegis TaxID=1735272 RepID=UPI001B8889B6|nr:clathrin interactor 1-like isoform X3 [Gigantopelta aegis]
MWKFREITDKVTNVVMNYSEVESKVREATNDDAWGPHGTLMQEIAQYTFTYEHFPEVMGMLWKRMLHENKKNWRRVYKGLTLLGYLIRNGSERVVTSTREHIYDLRALENYTFTDENGKDQGLNVRHKTKDILSFIQDDDQLRDERKKAKKTKDKFIGMSGESQGYNAYSDRYEEEPVPRGRNMDEIDDWGGGRKTIADEALDKVKDLWNRAHGRPKQGSPCDMSEDDEERTRRRNKYRDDWGNSDKDWDREYARERNQEREQNRSRYDYKDDDNEVTSVERTHTTRTEKITTTKGKTRQAKTLDLVSSSSAISDGQSSSSISEPSLIDVGAGSKGYSSIHTNTSFNEFNPRAVSPQSPGQAGDFGDFTQFQNGGTAASPKGQAGFADFSKFNSGDSPKAVSPQSSIDPFDPLGSPLAPSEPQLPSMQPLSAGQTGTMPLMQSPTQTGQPAMPMMNSAISMGIASTTTMSMGQTMGIQMVTNNMSTPGMAMPGQMPMVTQLPMQGTMGMMPGIQMGQQPVMVQSPMNPAPMMQPMQISTSGSLNHPQNILGSQNEDGTVKSSEKGLETNKKNTWTESGKVDINLESLNPANRFQKHASPSMNQLQQGNVISSGMTAVPPGMTAVSPGMAAVSPGMAAVSPGMAAVSPGMGAVPPGMGAMPPSGFQPNQPMMMMSPRPMMSPTMGMQPTVGMVGPVPAGSIGMPGSMQTSMMGQTAFQKRTDNAFSTFGNVAQ